MAQMLSLLDDNLPVTNELDRWKSPYPTQCDHMVNWFTAQPLQNGTGKYSRKDGNESTKIAYERFRNPGGLLWIAEALGENDETLRMAVAEELATEAMVKGSRCVGFRKVIPFSRILVLWTQPENWKISSEYLPYLLFDKRDGQPYVNPMMEDEFAELIKRKGH